MRVTWLFKGNVPAATINMAKIPIWKRWLSHIIEFEIEKLDSDYGHELSLCISDGKLQLNAERAIYSWEDKYDNFYKAFAKMKLEKLPGKECLVLGFGLGSIVQMLEQNFKQNMHFTGVEIDEQVIYLAEKYIVDKLKSPVQIINGSAEIFVEITNDKFDLICIDIFINDKIPHVIKEKAFLELCKNRLTEGGVLLFNHLSNSDAEESKGKAYFNMVFKAIFPKAALYDVNGNFIFVSDQNYLKK